MLKIKKIEKEGRLLRIYIKKPFNSSFSKLYDKIKKYLDKEASSHPIIDGSRKYMILTYLLRNKKDIEPYIKYGIAKEVCKDIYERLNEIQYLLKFTYSKKKIRRKVKEVMNLVEKIGSE